jgi:hypothetical protein
MLKLLSKLLGRDLTAPPQPSVEEDEHLSDAQILNEYFSVSTQAKQALKHFLTLVTAQLGATESQRLIKLVISHLGRGDTTSEAVESGILADEGQRLGKWVLLQVDWKATEEVEWQANELLAVAGITETWHPQGGTNTTVPRALLEFSSWVKPRGFRLLHLDLGNDAYYALLMSEEKSAKIVQIAKEADLKVQESDEFEVECRSE